MVSLPVALNHYLCQQAIDAKTKAVPITDTTYFFHHYLTQYSLALQDRLIHAIQTLTAAIHHMPSIHRTQQLQSIDHLCCLFQAWQETKTTLSPKPHAIPKVTRPDVTNPPQDKDADKPSRPQRHQKFPRVTPTSHTPPRNVDGVQYNFSSPKVPRHPSPRVSAPIDNRTRPHTEHTTIA